ncbi:MAG: ABC transporter [Rhizobiaceae bacterium]
MKRMIVIVVALFSVAALAGCASYGKGKAPEIVETNG